MLKIHEMYLCQRSTHPESRNACDFFASVISSQVRSLRSLVDRFGPLLLDVLLSWLRCAWMQLMGRILARICQGGAVIGNVFTSCDINRIRWKIYSTTWAKRYAETPQRLTVTVRQLSSILVELFCSPETLLFTC